MRVWLQPLIWSLLLGLGVCFVTGCASTGLNDEKESPDTKAAESNVQLGVEYMRQGKNDIAMEKLERALAQNPELPAAHHYIAVLHERLGQDERAEKHYRRAIRLDADNSRIHNNYGQFLCEQQRFEEAEKHFLAAVSDPLYEAKPLVYTNAGICAQRSGNMEKAEEYFRIALGIRPDFAPALLQMMKWNYEHGEYLKARGYLERYRSVAPVSATSLWWGVQVERALGDENAAASYALRLRADYPNSVEAKWLKEGK